MLPLLLGAAFLAAGGLMLLILLIMLLFGTQGGLWWMACLILLMGGTILTCLGIQGRYLARVYEEVKGRPLYVVGDTKGFDNEI